MTVRAGFEPLYATLTGERPTKPTLTPLCQALTQQIQRGGRGSDIAAAKLEGIRTAQMARSA